MDRPLWTHPSTGADAIDGMASIVTGRTGVQTCPGSYKLTVVGSVPSRARRRVSLTRRVASAAGRRDDGPRDKGVVVAHYDAVFIGGEWVAPAGSGRIAVENPATEEVVAEVAEGSGADVERAVAAARAAFPAWSALTRAQRADHLQALAARLNERKEEMAAVITSEMGAPA